MSNDLDKIKQMIDNGDCDIAEEVLEDILHLENNKNRRALFLYGLAAYKKNEYTIAHARYREGLKYDPESPWLLMGMIDSLIAQNEMKKATDVLLENRNKFTHMFPYQKKFIDFFINQGEFNIVLEQLENIDEKLLQSNYIAERLFESLLFTNDIDQYITSPRLFKLFENDNIVHHALFKIWRMGSRNKYKKNAEKLLQYLNKKNVYNKDSFILTIFFQLANYNDEAKKFIKNSISILSLNDIGLIYKNLFEQFNSTFILESFYRALSAFDFNNLEKFTVLAYIENTPLTKYSTVDEISDFKKKMEIDGQFPDLQEHLDNYFSKSMTSIEHFSIVSKPFKKPKVALCISGQLRGYQKTWESIKNSFVKPFDADVFVHTWRDIGFREPTFNLSQANRTFSSKTLNAWMEIGKVMKFEQARERYRAVWGLLPKGKITKDEIINFYGAKDCIVEDDQSEEFSSLNNVQKMYYKINAAYRLAKKNDDYDFMIRIRPDIMITKSKEFDSFDFLSKYKNSIICDKPLMLHPTFFFLGDQFALGPTHLMEQYCTIYQSAQDFKKHNFKGSDIKKAHEPLAWQMYRNNIDIISLSDIEEYQGAGLYDAQEPLNAKDIYEKLSPILEGSEFYPDRILLSALKEDIRMGR